MGPEILVGLLAGVAGVALGFGARRLLISNRLRTAEARAVKLVADAELEAETKVRQALLEVKEEIAATRRDAEDDVRVRREEVRRHEQRLIKREETIDSKLTEFSERERAIERSEREVEKLRAEAEALAGRHTQELERVGGMTAQEAKTALMAQIVDAAKREAMATVREIEQRAREEGEKRARKIVTIAIQRVASEQTTESTVSVFTLPSEDMKGRIIGREGRNIRAFESLTGVNLIVDDTPEAVVLSCFDPVRREVARQTLEKLVSDGRIQPARIEEMYERSLAEVDDQIKRAGEEALHEVGITEIHPEMIKVLGRLRQ